MKNLETLLQKSAELNEKRTQGEWERITSGHVITRGGYVTHEWNHGTKGTTDVICKPHIEHNVGVDDENNFLFIAYAANTHALLCEIIRVQQKALEKISLRGMNPDAKIHGTSLGVWSIPAGYAADKVAREALQKVDEIAKGTIK